MGVYAFLWIDFIVIPNLILLPLLAWRWGIWHAGLFFAYSIAMASAYLALELTLIEEVPFSEQLDPSRGYGLLGAMMAGGLVIAIAVALQYLLIFRSSGIVAITVLTLGVAAYFVTRASVGAFAASMQYHLSLASAAVGPFYSEVR